MQSYIHSLHSQTLQTFHGICWHAKSQALWCFCLLLHMVMPCITAAAQHACLQPAPQSYSLPSSAVVRLLLLLQLLLLLGLAPRQVMQARGALLLPGGCSSIGHGSPSYNFGKLSNPNFFGSSGLSSWCQQLFSASFLFQTVDFMCRHVLICPFLHFQSSELRLS
jgi:hypothetical protein